MDFEQARTKVQTPATALLVVGVIGVILGLLGALGSAVQVVMMVVNGGTDALMAGGVSMIGSVIGLFFTVLFNGFVIFGAGKMKKLESYNLVMAASVVAALPCCSGICCLIGLPIGAWCIMTLMDEEVKAAFQGNAGAAM